LFTIKPRSFWVGELEHCSCTEPHLFAVILGRLVANEKTIHASSLSAILTAQVVFLKKTSIFYERLENKINVRYSFFMTQ
jgi:hypothetical protein